MKYEITKYQIEKLADEDSIVKDCLKEWFPDAFKAELEIGKWYKGSADIEFLICYQGNGNDNYGFWQDQPYRNNISFGDYWDDMLRLATDEEVSAALIAEAKKRGFVEGVKYLSPLNKYRRTFDGEMYFDNNNLYENGKSIFNNGIWAEILPQEKTIVPMEKALKIIKGEKYICRKDFVFCTGSIHFTRGNVYQSEKDGSLLNNLNQPHYFSEAFAYKHFLHLPK